MNALLGQTEKIQQSAANSTGGLVNSNGGTINDKIYRQCLATLMLEVYYRFLPGTGEGAGMAFNRPVL